MATACETVVLGGVRELPRRVSPRCQPRPGRWLRRNRRGFLVLLLPARASVRGGGSTAAAMHGKPAPRGSRARRNPTENGWLWLRHVDINVRGFVFSCSLGSALLRSALVDRQR